MKPSIIQRSFSNKNLFSHGILLGLLFWIGAQIPFSFILSQYLSRQQVVADLAQQASLQKLLTELYEQGARFGDIVYARGAVLKFGTPFGLKDLGVCHGNEEILPRPIETRCKLANAQRVPIRTAADTVALEFEWTPPSLAGHQTLMQAIGVSAILSLLLVAGVVLLLSRRLSSLVSKLANQIASARSLETLTQLSSELKELRPISDALRGAKIKLSESLNENMRLKTEAALGTLAAQVAHDIQSPLAALTAAENDLAALPEEARILVGSAVSRIRDIASNLLQKNREIMARATDPGTEIMSREVTSSQLLSGLIEPLISEKRLQFRSKIGITIEGRLSVDTYGLFASVESREFKRVISNLINNSVEALGDKGRVAITLDHGPANTVLIRVTDNGRGIAPEILAKLGQRGGTHGKEGGSGLGLYHAHISVKSWGGTLKLESEVDKGTTVVITLPKAHSPAWFISRLELKPDQAIVILDDDDSVHRIWQGRYDSLKAEKAGIKIHHLFTPQEFSTWVTSTPEAGTAMYLVDYELLGFKETGLSLIERHALGQQAVLVTARFEEPAILSQCDRLGVKLIPKGLAGMVPIVVSPN